VLPPLPPLLPFVWSAFPVANPDTSTAPWIVMYALPLTFTVTTLLAVVCVLSQYQISARSLLLVAE
jgi:hypothetical protein